MSTKDKIQKHENYTQHESAGGFLFYKNPDTESIYVALLKDRDDKYVVPKGHIKEGESSKEAAKRELKEELSLDVDSDIVSFLDTSSYSFQMPDGSEHKKKVYLYIFRVGEKVKIKPNKSEGIKSAEWFLFEDALEKISFDKEYLKKAKDILS